MSDKNIIRTTLFSCISFTTESLSMGNSEKFRFTDRLLLFIVAIRKKKVFVKTIRSELQGI